MWFFIYVALISTIGCVLVAYDKAAAKTSGGIRRVRERTICALSVIGGAVSMLLLMLAIRHKTQHTFIMVLTSFMAVLWLLGYTAALCMLL